MWVTDFASFYPICQEVKFGWGVMGRGCGSHVFIPNNHMIFACSLFLV